MYTPPRTRTVAPGATRHASFRWVAMRGRPLPAHFESRPTQFPPSPQRNRRQPFPNRVGTCCPR